MIKCYELSIARLMNENGLFTRIEIIPDDSKGFVVAFVDATEKYSFLKAQRGNIRYFKTLDSAFNAVQSLGSTDCKLVIADKVKDKYVLS